MPPVHQKVDGQWRVVSRDNVFAKVSGSWREAQQVWVKENGTWRALYNNVVASIWVSSTRPTAGRSVTIRWSSSNATSVSVTRDGTQISTAASGSTSVSRSSAGSDTFAITATGSGGTATDSVTVTRTAIPSPQTRTFTASGTYTVPAGATRLVVAPVGMPPVLADTRIQVRPAAVVAPALPEGRRGLPVFRRMEGWAVGVVRVDWVASMLLAMMTGVRMVQMGQTAARQVTAMEVQRQWWRRRQWRLCSGQ